ncbi:hypothetical protein GM418_03460 [Maribellus comscasis]|uniref:Sulfotransferase domain-containing protein n=1 Tax=Maribellus comscasis TaxID=2681766 RepID=A0A6I6JRF5_9BACT|nr:sulfotransferase [Maribellus comscasis]QGY42742.1 hypothetical protein GM418_03460 [Maribellus comscasis]
MKRLKKLKIIKPTYIKNEVVSRYNSILVSKKQKVFCIGLNKTGTSSLKKEMEQQNYIVGIQRQAELLFDDWVKRDFRRIINYCKTAQFFQDAPFSYPYTFIAIDQAFPKSKFILTIRDNAEAWYNSLIRFHRKIWGNGNVPPTAEDLKNANYIYKGFPYYSSMSLRNVPKDNPYKKDVLIDFYETYNKNIKDYFRHRPNDLLIINLKEKDSYGRFCNFLGIEKKKEHFPWENRT